MVRRADQAGVQFQMNRFDVVLQPPSAVERLSAGGALERIRQA